jgi:orotate phosphoribosyltransferase
LELHYSFLEWLFFKNTLSLIRKVTLKVLFLWLIKNKNNTTAMKALEKITAEKLLGIKAIKLQPSNPFTWASGWKSPIYCDNRKLMSYPTIRNFLKIQFGRIILEKYPDVEAIAGVATGAIAPGAIVADLLGLPFVYVRATPKGHGLENLIEGDLKPNQKVIVIEDLVSTGISSLKAVEAIRKDGANVIGMVSIFTYDFPIATKNMQEANVELTSLSNYDAILEEAVRTEYIDESELQTLQDWRENPDTWGKTKK